LRTPGTDESLVVAPNNATQISLTFDDNQLASVLFGQYGQNLALIERKLGVAANSRGNQVTIDGTREACELARRVLEGLYERLKRGDELVAGDVEGAIRLAIAHRACEESLAMTNRHVLEGTIRSLEAAVGTGAERSRRLVQRRLGIAYRRAECWSKTRDSLEAIGHQLATITELVLLLHQESLAPTGTAWGTVEVDRILADFEDGEGALRELVDIGIDGPLELDAACSRRMGG